MKLTLTTTKSVTEEIELALPRYFRWDDDHGGWTYGRISESGVLSISSRQGARSLDIEISSSPLGGVSACMVDPMNHGSEAEFEAARRRAAELLRL